MHVAFQLQRVSSRRLAWTTTAPPSQEVYIMDRTVQYDPAQCVMQCIILGDLGAQGAQGHAEAPERESFFQRTVLGLPGPSMGTLRPEGL